MSTHDAVIDSDPYNLAGSIDSGQYKVLRQSLIGQADICLKRVEFDLDPDKVLAGNEARAVGTGYHAGVARYYQERKDGGPVQPEDLTPFLETAHDAFSDAVTEAGDRFMWDSDRGKAEEKLTRMLTAYFANGCMWPEEYKIIAVEHTFLMPFNLGWVAKGTLDLVVEQPDTGWQIIDDHKTAKVPWRKNKESHRAVNQPAWYQWFWQQLNPDLPGVAFTYSIMSAGGKFERRPVTILPEHRTGLMAKGHLLTKLIDDGGPFYPNPGHYLCSEKFCDNYQQCPWGEGFGA